jgi:hypothetical protein
MKRFGHILTASMLVLLAFGFVCNTTKTAAQSQAPILYSVPRSGAQYVSPWTTLALHSAAVLDRSAMAGVQFVVVGSRSGRHQGTASLSDDDQTIVFKPSQPFVAGESVNVVAGAGLKTVSQNVLGEFSYRFTIAPAGSNVSPEMVQQLRAGDEGLPATEQPISQASAGTKLLTMPGSLPVITVTVPATGTDDGYLFLAPFSRWGTSSPYFAIMDNSGQPVYYGNKGTFMADLKKQPNGWLTYFSNDRFYAMDSNYSVVGSYKATAPYDTDPHDLQLLPNGHALLTALDYRTMDLSQIQAGGYPTATVIGLVIQEFDSANQVVFEWRSWDHFHITDTQVSLTTPVVDYVHANAVELDSDANILLSSRHLSEITKINRQTGEIMWRLGGNNNQFTFVGDTAPYFHFQHDIRRLPNGHITLFDNRTSLAPNYSRAVEYALDEAGKIANLVWQYRNTPDSYAMATGNNQRLPNGNTLISWGTTSLVTEVKPDNSKAFEAQFPRTNYRAFRFPWHATPTVPPVLVQQTQGLTTTLTYSWNGATEVAEYRVYGGSTPHPTTLIAIQARTGFETQTSVPHNPGQCAYFVVMPVDKVGHETMLSNEVSTCLQSYLPILTKLSLP